VVPGLASALRGAGLPGAELTAAGVPANVLGGPFFLTGSNASLYATAAALCNRIYPTGRDPLTKAVTSPGATEANAVQFIDMFLAAFELPGALADNPAIYLQGRLSGRNPYPPADADEPGALHFGASSYPADQLVDSSGQRQFLGLTPQQAVAWYLRLYGTVTGLPAQYRAFVPSGTWVRLAAGNSPLIPGVPGPTGLRGIYVAGLTAVDAWSKQNFAVPFAAATTLEQDAMALVLSNPVVGAASSNGLPGLPAPLPSPVPPAAAAQLFPYLVVHTIQGCFCLPEYGGNGGSLVPPAQPAPAPVMWAEVGWDGDTMPLGNSVYDPDAAGADDPPNAGFGAPGVYRPTGNYVEYRPVSTLDDSDTGLATLDELAALVSHLAGKANVKLFGSSSRLVP
jgi:hypothetical protein